LWKTKYDLFVKNLITRTITGILFVAVLAGGILWNVHSIGFLFLAVAVGCYVELWNVFGGSKHKPWLAGGLITGIILYVSVFFAATGVIIPKYLFLLVPLFFLVMVAELLTKKGYSTLNVSLTFLGVIYIFIPFSLTSIVVKVPFEGISFNPGTLLGILILIWVNDVFAYLGGLILGRHKLYEKLSPNKTWEGTITGILFTIVASYPVSLIFKGISLTDWAILSIMISVLGIFGDLFESMIKRNNQLKDSGKLLPGHGGLLDRFDAFLFAMPVATAYIILTA
jgi:phosphatidate cytidylyltransferase